MEKIQSIFSIPLDAEEKAAIRRELVRKEQAISEMDCSQPYHNAEQWLIVEKGFDYSEEADNFLAIYCSKW